MTFVGDENQRQFEKEHELLAILQKYKLDFVRKRELPFVVKPSVPVVWFGDSKR